MKTIFQTIVLCGVALCASLATESVEAQSLGQQVVLANVTLPPATTNTYTPFSTNQIFIGTSDLDNLGVGIGTAVATNSASTNLPGTITVRLAKSVDGTAIVENTPSIVLTLANTTASYYNATNGITWYSGMFTNLDVHGCAGLFITSLENTNLGVNSATNTVLFKILAKAAKTEAIPATTKN